MFVSLCFYEFVVCLYFSMFLLVVTLEKKDCNVVGVVPISFLTLLYLELYIPVILRHFHLVVVTEGRPPGQRPR